MAAHASFGSLDFATCPHKKTPDIFYLRHQPYKLLLVYLCNQLKMDLTSNWPNYQILMTIQLWSSTHWESSNAQGIWLKESLHVDRTRELSNWSWFGSRTWKQQLAAQLLNAWHPLIVCRYLLSAREEKIVNPKEEPKPPKWVSHMVPTNVQLSWQHNRWCPCPDGDNTVVAYKMMTHFQTRYSKR